MCYPLGKSPACMALKQDMVQVNRTLLRILLFLLILFALDRAIAYIHIPEEGSKNITLYSTQWCSYCASLRMYFDTHGIKYKEYDVEKSALGAFGLWAFRARGVPIVVIGTEVIYGFDLNKVSSALTRLESNLVTSSLEK